MARTTHAHEGDLALFLIGMTFPKPWRVDRWLPAFVAMPRMLAELSRNKAAADRGEEEWLGFLGARTTIGLRGPTVIQYWRSVDDIFRYASATGRAHRPAWQAFNAKVRKAGEAVGIWHETYAVPAGGHESIYAGLSPIGLGAFTGSVSLGRRGDTASDSGAPRPSVQ